MYKKVTALLTGAARPGKKIKPQWLTIHNTANDKAGADAIANRNYFQNNPQVKANAHWVVDDKQAVLCIPEDEMAWHTGRKEGNETSIGLEVCENRDADPEAIYANAVTLAADIIHRHSWGIAQMRTHKSWSGKNCPRKLLQAWDRFVADVAVELERINGVKVTVNGQLAPAKARINQGRAEIMIGNTWEPAREIADALGLKLSWDEATRTVAFKI